MNFLGNGPEAKHDTRKCNMTMKTYTGALGKKGETPQSMPIPGTNQVQNNAGGYSFQIDELAKLERFLILGSEGGTYYASACELTIDNAKHVERLAKDPKVGPKAVALIVEISEEGRAPKNDPAIFALAVCIKNGADNVKALAQAAVPKVCRTGTHMFQMAEALDALGGWGRGTKRALASWYTNQTVDELAYQIVKYQSREGWSHRDVLRKLHINPGSTNGKMSRLFRYAVGKGTEKNVGYLPEIVQGFEEIKGVTDAKVAVKLIEKYGLPRECVPTELLNDTNVWRSLLTSGKGMPVTAMVRNLGKMTSIGLITEGSDEARYVVSKLLEGEDLVRSMIHPVQLLMALKTYAQGHGMLGKLSWTPSRRVVDALDEAFYRAFKNVKPTGKRFNLALDVSGSMHMDRVAGTPLTPAQAAVAMALVTMNVERDVALFGFGTIYRPLPISKSDRLDKAVAKIQGMNFGGTDTSLQIRSARSAGEKYDVFCTYTDNETWAGQTHAVQELTKYRKETGIPAKMVVVGMTSTDFTIADPNDPGQLDVVGFDSATPSLIADFCRK